MGNAKYCANFPYLDQFWKNGENPWKWNFDVFTENVVRRRMVTYARPMKESQQQLLLLLERNRVLRGR